MGQMMFGKDLKGVRLFRLTNEDECHRGFKYKTGVNTDTLPFNDHVDEDCVAGGLYFTNAENIISFMDCETKYIREVTIENDEPVIIFGNKYRAHSIILGERMDLTEPSTWEYLIKCGVNIRAQDDLALRFAAYNGHIEVVKYLREHGVDIHAYDNVTLR